jgi:hypothetical protein
MQKELAAAGIEDRPATGLALEQRTRELLLEVRDMLLTEGCEIPSWREAAAKLPVSATVIKTWSRRRVG